MISLNNTKQRRIHRWTQTRDLGSLMFLLRSGLFSSLHISPCLPIQLSMIYPPPMHFVIVSAIPVLAGARDFCDERGREIGKVFSEPRTRRYLPRKALSLGGAQLPSPTKGRGLLVGAGIDRYSSLLILGRLRLGATIAGARTRWILFDKKTWTLDCLL